jgi:hypothetical protein
MESVLLRSGGCIVTVLEDGELPTVRRNYGRVVTLLVNISVGTVTIISISPIEID